MVKIYQKTIKDKELKEVPAFKVGSWIYVEDPTEEEIKTVAKKFSLDQSLLRDALDLYEVPRMEIEAGNTYVFTRVPYGEGGRIFTVPLLIIVGENFVVTVCQRALPFLDQFLKSKIDFSTTQKTKFFLQIFVEITSSYNSLLANIQRRVRSVGIHLGEITNKDIVQFVTFEGVLNDFISALIPTTTILNNLLSGRSLALYEEDRELIEDLALGNGQLIELCKSNLKTIVNIREAYSAIVTNNLNRVIKLLTALTIIIAVPTMIASFYGMNVALPGAQSPATFLWILGITVSIGGILFLIFARNKWL